MRKVLNKINMTFILIIAFLFLCSTEVYSIIKENNKVNSWIINKPIAHRGLHNNLYPENSMSAFKRAIDNKFPIELDVLLTKDNKVVVIHDLSLKRLTGDPRKVDAITYGELKNLKLLGSSEEIPLFKDVLEEVDGKVPILIEIKSCSRVLELVNETNKLLEKYKGEYAIQSFDRNVLEWYINNNPQVTVGILLKNIDNEQGLKVYNDILLDSNNKPDFISIKLQGVQNQKIKSLREIGYPIITWTVGTSKEQIKAKTYSDNFIFEGNVF